MRKIVVLTFMSMDGVMQAPGGPDEDTSGNFTLGGWSVPYFDEFVGQEMGNQMSVPFDLLLGRKTFEIFAAYWPEHTQEGEGINNATKYVVSTTLKEHSWQKTVFINTNVVEEIKKLKESEGPDIQVHGSQNLIQSLLKNDLVDELWLKIFPITIGSGKKLFDSGTVPAAYKLIECKNSPSGVIIASYKRDGQVTTGSF